MKKNKDISVAVRLVRSMLSPVITDNCEPEENPENGEGNA